LRPKRDSNSRVPYLSRAIRDWHPRRAEQRYAGTGGVNRRRVILKPVNLNRPLSTTSAPFTGPTTRHGMPGCQRCQTRACLCRLCSRGCNYIVFAPRTSKCCHPAASYFTQIVPEDNTSSAGNTAALDAALLARSLRLTMPESVRAHLSFARRMGQDVADGFLLSERYHDV
jgi:hypothetical protein